MRERTGKKKSRLESWLKSATTPVFLVSATRRVLFFNAGCEQLTGWTADEVVGEVAEYVSESESQSLPTMVNALCPPPEVLAGREQDVPVFVPHKNGSPAAKLVRFIPVMEAADRVTSVLGIISELPVTPSHQPTSLALRYHAELSALRWSLKQRYGLKTVIAHSPVMQRVLEQIQMARQSRVPVHFSGPRGVGKEHLARAIHHEGDSPLGAFVPLDCQQSPFDLLEMLKRLLHPQGDDFPIASQQLRTLFLIDVTQLTRDVQERLLAAYRDDAKSGARRSPLPRLMSSSSEPLAIAVTDDRLLPELFFRLTPLIIDVPALRQRMDDLAPLAQAFLESLNRGVNRQVAGFSDSVWTQLREYHWPGNLDELLLVVQEARDNSSGPMIDVKDLPLRFRAGLDGQSIGPMQRAFAAEPIPQLEAHLASVERDLIDRALAQAKQNKTLAAKLLGIPRTVLYRRLEALGYSDQVESGKGR